MVDPAVKVPVTLSSAEWKKREVTTALTRKKTGISEALQKFEAVYSGWIGWGYLGRDVLARNLTEFKKSGNYLYMVDVVKHFRESGAFMSNLTHHLDQVRTLAETHAKEFKASPLVPKATREFLEKMAQECNSFPAAVEAELANRGKFIRSAIGEASRKDPSLSQRLHM